MRIMWLQPSELYNPRIISLANGSSLGGGEGFDTTLDVFDTKVVNEYLNGTGQLGGPLVTAPEIANRSDYRLYISDKNATMQSISLETAFQTKCNALFERMINTVPSTVTLSNPIVPFKWKAVEIALDILSTGIVSTSGLICNLYTTTAPPAFQAAPHPLGQATHFPGTGTSRYGNTTYFPFNSILAPGTTSLSFKHVSYPINDSIFVL